MDASTFTVTVKSLLPGLQELIDAKVYSVSCTGECHEQIVEIIRKIKKIWGKEILEVGI